MSPENYEHVVGSFDWSTVYDALGWTPGEKVSLGKSIVDRHVGSDRSALIAVARDGTERRLSYRDISRATCCGKPGLGRAIGSPA
jgi:hypothetical protein